MEILKRFIWFKTTWVTRRVSNKEATIRTEERGVKNRFRTTHEQHTKKAHLSHHNKQNHVWDS